MVLVDQVNVMTEGSNKVLYLRTEQGSYHQTINNNFATKIDQIISNKKSFYNKLILAVTLKKLSLFEEHVATLNIDGQQMQSSWEEVLPNALESDIAIYIDSNLLSQEYSCEDIEHQEFVDALLLEEQIFDQSIKIKKLFQSLTQSLEDERYEEAAILRDRIEAFEGSFIL